MTAVKEVNHKELAARLELSPTICASFLVQAQTMCPDATFEEEEGCAKIIFPCGDTLMLEKLTGFATITHSSEWDGERTLILADSITNEAIAQGLKDDDIEEGALVKNDDLQTAIVRITHGTYLRLTNSSPTS